LFEESIAMMKSGLVALAALTLTPFASALEVKVSYSDAFRETLAEDYGEREGAYLASRVEHQLQRALSRATVAVARVDVVIEKAKPSKPTFKQLGDEPGLDYGLSVSAGGMDLSGVAYDASGAKIAELDYAWFETDIRDAGLSTWYDAGRASDRFARKFAKKLASAS
jgi:hypothetical protein